MDAESNNDVKESITSTDTEIKRTKKNKKGVLSRLWGAIFRLHGDDFEKRLQYISKEEAAVLSRITRRSNSWRRMTRHLILFSVLLEAIAVGYAIMTTRSEDLNWKMRALHVLPMFLLPVLSSIIYISLRSFTRMFDWKDHKTLENLRAERQAKINELKEKTNYYTTQQLIQRYDPDPAAKAAAATVLAHKLGADSGLKVHMGDSSMNNSASGKSNDVEVARTSGLRNRKTPISRISNRQNASMNHDEEMSDQGFDGAEKPQQHQMVVEHRPQAGSTTNNGGWIARFAALLVGEDPRQSYALICGQCHMHNGLARKEDIPYITYYCPHCHALNRPHQAEHVSGLNSTEPTRASSVVEDVVPSAGGSVGDTISVSNSPVAAAVESS
ncbi:hypothetical protein ACS0TY_024146 [Phlomoides rotata]